MLRVLDPKQIEAFAERDIPRIRLPDGAQVFARRAERLRHLSAAGGRGHGAAIADYLRLMAVVVEAQQAALAALDAPRLSDEETARARSHAMPVAHAAGFKRDPSWRSILGQLCGAALRTPELPAAVRDLCSRLRDLPASKLEAQADALLAARTTGTDTAAAPFIMSALQVYWVRLVSPLAVADVGQLEVPGICPVCGSLPVASVIRVDKGSPGYRYLHCALCATEWHMVRVTCSQCLAVQGVTYHLIEGGSQAIRAESCGSCRSYRKIFHQEKDMQVEPVADDLASLALDLLMSAEGYHRASGNPLLWQSR
jgi:FdhE protein